MIKTKKHLGIRIDADTKDKLDKLAYKQRRTVSNLVIGMIEQGLKK